MIRPFRLALLAAAIIPAAVQAQQGAAALPIRAVLHDPVNPAAELYLPEQSGQIAKLKLVAEGFSEQQIALPANGSLVLYNKATIDRQNPAAALAASAKIPDDMRRALVVVVPNKPGASPAYRMLLIDDSPGKFPGGESRVVNMAGFDAAMEAGEHKLPLKSAQITRVPEVTKCDEFNMAQTNFYYKEGEAWTPFTERRLQFLKEFRRVFLIYLTPGSTQPFVTTVLDTIPAETPKPVERK
ncbi:MAG: hypothetical protein J0M04_24865 [Verrucomicrobia bacterium]|nr:hypothetical protein [Verrucomicrobiota bacterium]